MTFDEILLALLAHQPRSGYDLRKWLGVEGVFIRANADQSQIYRTLRRLEKSQFVRHDVVRRSGPDSKIYHLTEAGRDQLLTVAEAPYEPPARWQEADFQARLSLLGPLVPHTVVPLIEAELEFRRGQIRIYRNRPREAFAPSEHFDVDPRNVALIASIGDQHGRDSMDRWLEHLERLRAAWTAERQDARSTDSSSSS